MATVVNIETNNFKNNQTHSIGDFLLVDGELCIISQVDPHKVCVISIKGSNRYEDPIYVENLRSISFEFIKKMAGDEALEIIPVKSVNIKVEL